MTTPIAYTADLSDAPIAPAAAPAVFASGIEGFTYADLRDPAGLARLLGVFESYARAEVPAAQWEAYLRYRDQGAAGMSPEEVSDALLAVAPRVSAFLARLFRVEAGRDAVAAAIATEGDVLAFKREFVKKRTARRKRTEIDALSPEARASLDADARAVLAKYGIEPSPAVAAALEPLTLNGPHGSLLDGAGAALLETRFDTFELETLMATPTALGPVLGALFHELERGFDGRPTLLVLDEASMIERPVSSWYMAYQTDPSLANSRSRCLAICNCMIWLVPS